MGRSRSNTSIGDFTWAVGRSVKCALRMAGVDPSRSVRVHYAGYLDDEVDFWGGSTKELCAVIDCRMGTVTIRVLVGRAWIGHALDDPDPALRSRFFDMRVRLVTDHILAMLARRWMETTIEHCQARIKFGAQRRRGAA